MRLISQRGRPAHVEKVLSALLNEWRKDQSLAGEAAVKFGSLEQGSPVVDCRKLTEYALNDQHPDGKHKAVLFRELLDIRKEDWAFLAEQLVAGLQKEMVERPRKSDHGVQYHVDIPVVGRNGVKKLVRTGWIIQSNQPPRLTTALIPRGVDTRAAAALQGSITKALGRTDWQQLYDSAHDAGLEAAKSWIPTSMFIGSNAASVEYVEPEGECGVAWVSNCDAS